MPVATAKKRSGERHHCVQYPVTFFVASSATNSGSMHMPRVIAASTIHFGPGHPLNRTEILYPDSDGYMPPNSSTGPRLSIITRRSLLLGFLQALVSVKDIYRVGRAQTCLHIRTSSRYLDLVWNEWLPDWEKNGWPTKESEQDQHRSNFYSSSSSIRQKDLVKPRARRNSSISMSNRSIANSTMTVKSDVSGVTAMTGDGHLIYDDDTNRLVNEDLLRKVAIFRRNFFTNSAGNDKGAAYVQLINYRENPADRLAKDTVRATSLDMTTRLPHRDRSSSVGSTGTAFSGGDTGSIRRPSSNGNGNIIRGPATTPVPTTSSSHSLTAGAAPSLPAAIPAMVKRPAQKSRMLSKDIISEAGEETDMDEFDDAASTLSMEAPQQSTVAKVLALPVAAVAATVAAVMVVDEEPVAPVVERSSFEQDTNDALAAVKVPTLSQEDDTVTELDRKESVKNLPRKLSTRSRNSEPPSEPVLLSKNSTIRRKQSTKSDKENGRAPIPQPAQPQRPAAPTKRRSFLFFGKKEKVEEEAAIPAASPVTTKPATDRLIDYRPPQSRHLRSTRPAQTFRDLSSRSGEVVEEEDQEAPAVENAATTTSQTTKKKRPISFFRTRAHVREIFG